MKIAAGALNSRVTIKSPSATQDSIGQMVPSWSDVATVWANIRHLSGMEGIKADALSSLVKASIKIRKRPGVDAGMRVYHGSVVYDIRAVLPDEVSRDKMYLVCEVVNG